MKCACLQVTVDDAGNGAVAATQVKSLLQTTTTTTHSEQLSLLAAGREKLKQKRERKAARTLVSVWSVSRYGVQGTARTLAIVTGTFVVCWLPFFIVALVQPFYAISEAYPATLASSVIMWLGYVNSLLNPAAGGADDVTRPITSSVRGVTSRQAGARWSPQPGHLHRVQPGLPVGVPQDAVHALHVPSPRDRDALTQTVAQ